MVTGKLAEMDVEDDYKEFVPPISESKFNNMMIKHGSLQKFIENTEQASDYGVGCYSDE